MKWSCSVVSNSLYPMDCSLSGSSVHGSFQARILEWVAISFSRGSSQPRDRTRVSHIVGRRFTIWATREALYRLYYKELQNECNTQPWRLFILNLNGWENLETEWQAPGVNSNESTYITLPHNILPPFSAHTFSSHLKRPVSSYSKNLSNSLKGHLLAHRYQPCSRPPYYLSLHSDPPGYG